MVGCFFYLLLFPLLCFPNLPSGIKKPLKYLKSTRKKKKKKKKRPYDDHGNTRFCNPDTRIPPTTAPLPREPFWVSGVCVCVCGGVGMFHGDYQKSTLDLMVYFGFCLWYGGEVGVIGGLD
ncbi:hypothetical protein BDZ91DRAFT_369201 [Kalaharituber pfeilii]|nr:hypothetical protein BDZ91DRAFT_369201 [Kalaharituber pfeilii]